MSILVAVLGLGLLVFVHELGHFGASIALRMRPRKFYVGFPPAMVKTTRNGIEYGIGTIPLGGFVKIPGMHRPAPGDVDVAFDRAIEEAPQAAPAAIRLRESLAAGDLAAARLELAAVGEHLDSRELSEPARRSAERGLTDLEDALGPDAYWRAKTWKRVLVIAAGPLANILLALVLFAVLFMTSGGRATTTIDQVATDAPAAAAGLRAGDRIVLIDGMPVDAEDISRRISGSNGAPLTLKIERSGGLMDIGPVRAQEMDGAYRLGFVLRGEGLGLAESVGESFRITGLVTRDIVSSLGRLVTGEGRDDIASPIGIVQGSSDAADEGVDSFLWVLGLISLSIALLNLLPLLPLDGGHIAFAIVEGVRGRAVRREIYERVSIVGIGIVLLLFFIGVTNDIGRLS
ncbi:MAG TPA: M50 family metallopeptidase [Gaiellaceae bacterium]|nr:M50 family metallopeptidase [Gaiellaceae bacterium]